MIVLGGWGTIYPVGHYIVLVAMVDKIWPISTPYTTENELIEFASVRSSGIISLIRDLLQAMFSLTVQ